jgi:hypothetical protein
MKTNTSLALSSAPGLDCSVCWQPFIGFSVYPSPEMFEKTRAGQSNCPNRQYQYRPWLQGVMGSNAHTCFRARAPACTDHEARTIRGATASMLLPCQCSENCRKNGQKMPFCERLITYALQRNMAFNGYRLLWWYWKRTPL